MIALIRTDSTTSCTSFMIRHTWTLTPLSSVLHWDCSLIVFMPTFAFVHHPSSRTHTASLSHLSYCSDCLSLYFFHLNPTPGALSYGWVGWWLVIVFMIFTYIFTYFGTSPDSSSSDLYSFSLCSSIPISISQYFSGYFATSSLKN